MSVWIVIEKSPEDKILSTGCLAHVTEEGAREHARLLNESAPRSSRFAVKEMDVVDLRGVTP